MKQIITILLALFATSHLFAQSQAMVIKDNTINFDSGARYEYNRLVNNNPNDTSEGGILTEFNRWREFYSGRVARDAPAGSNIMNDAMRYFAKDNLV